MLTQLGFIDYLSLLIYLGFVIGIGFALKRYTNSAEDFVLSGRAIPALALCNRKT